MFERYVEKSRRVIFFARYEASQYGSPYIETEHLLLALLREDKDLANRFLPFSAIEAIRRQIDQSSTPREKTSTSVDLPLSHECKRVLAYAAEESERMHHKHIETHHLLLGLLREEKTFAAHLLRQHGLQPERVREEVSRSGLGSEQTRVNRAEPPEALVKLLSVWEEHGGVTVATGASVANHTPDFAIYPSGALKTEGQATPSTPEEEVALLTRQLKFIVRNMERAIAGHEFEKAKFFSEEERKQRERLRQLRELYNLTEPTAAELSDPRPLLCIDIVRDDRFSDMRKRFADYLAVGVEQVWLLDFFARRSYTVTTADGLREFIGKTLRITNPALELNLESVFS